MSEEEQATRIASLESSLRLSEERREGLLKSLKALHSENLNPGQSLESWTAMSDRIIINAINQYE